MSYANIAMYLHCMYGACFQSRVFRFILKILLISDHNNMYVANIRSYFRLSVSRFINIIIVVEVKLIHKAYNHSSFDI